MKKQSWVRQSKRKAMREAKMTFTERVRESIRTGKPVQGINWIENKPTVKVG